MQSEFDSSKSIKIYICSPFSSALQFICLYKQGLEFDTALR